MLGNGYDSILEIAGENIVIIIGLLILFSFFQGLSGIIKIQGINKEIVLLEKEINKYRETIEKENEENEEEIKFSKKELLTRLLSSKKFYKIGGNLRDYLKSEFLGVEKCFNEVSILEKNLNITNIQSKGQTLIGQGVLGTFIGLIIALKGIDTSNAENISQVLNGINTAFITSILGMIFSLVYNSIYKITYGRTSKNISNIVYELEIMFPTVTSALMLQEVKFSLDTFVKNVGNKLNTEMEKEAKNIFSKYQGGFDKAIQNVGTSVSKELGKVFDALFIEKFDAIKDSFIKSLELTTKELNESRDLLKDLGKTLPGILKGIREIEDSSENIKIYSKETNRNYEQFINKFPEKETEFLAITDFQNKLKNTIEIINDSLVINSKDVVMMSEILKDQVVNILEESKSAKKISEETRNTLEEYSAKSKELQEELLKTTKLSYERYLSLTKEGQFEFAQGVEKALTEYDNITAEILSKVLKIKKNETDMKNN